MNSHYFDTRCLCARARVGCIGPTTSELKMLFFPFHKDFSEFIRFFFSHHHIHNLSFAIVPVSSSKLTIQNDVDILLKILFIRRDAVRLSLDNVSVKIFCFVYCFSCYAPVTRWEKIRSNDSKRTTKQPIMQIQYKQSIKNSFGPLCPLLCCFCCRWN